MNIDIHGDIYIETIEKLKHYYLRSINGFYLAASASTKKIWEFELLNKSLDFKGEADIWLGENQSGNRLFEINTVTGLDASLGFSVDNYLVAIDANITPGFVKLGWNLDGDCDGYISADSSPITGPINIEAKYQGYGIKATITGHLDANSFLVQWDPLKLSETIIIPINWTIQGSLDVGLADINFTVDNGEKWYNIYPACKQVPNADAGGPYSGKVGQTVIFDASKSSDPQGKTLEYKWDFDYQGIGDITWDTGWLTTPTTTHTYNTEKQYDVRLLVREQSNSFHLDVDYTQVSITTIVNENPEVYLHLYYTYNLITYNPAYTTANGYTTYDQGLTNRDYTFRATKLRPLLDGGGDTNDPDGTIAAYLWTAGGQCFLGGTKVSMADGSYKNIEDVKIGDFVKVYDENTGTIVSNKVTKVFHHEAKEMDGSYLIINHKLRVTPNHLIFVNGEWKSAGKIEIGDTLMDINKNTILVNSIERIYGKVPTFNLEVENHHNYFADNILVHNSKAWTWVTCINNYISPKTWTWTQPGEYEVTLTVRDNNGAVSSATIMMHINSGGSDSGSVGSGGSSSDSVDSSVSIISWETFIARIN